MAEQQEPGLDNGNTEEHDVEAVDDVALRPGPNADDAADTGTGKCTGKWGQTPFSSFGLLHSGTIFIIKEN
jgi:hypothetical protein